MALCLALAVPLSHKASAARTDARLVEWDLQLPVEREAGERIKASGANCTAAGCADSTGQPSRTAGYAELSGTHDAKMFYFYFPSRMAGAGDPVGIWIHGGPGCSGSLAVFYESGPYRFGADGQLKDEDFKFGWDAAGLHMVYVDQPVGTGWSYVTEERDLASTERAVGRHVVAFLEAFYKAHPDLADRELYLMGVSYAGHMVPSIARAIREADAAGEGPLGRGRHVKLAGITLGNPWVSPRLQYAAYADFALAEGLISASKHDEMQGDGMAACTTAIDTCDARERKDREVCLDAWRLCQHRTFDVITSSNPGINVYDIRKRCQGGLCYDFSALVAYMQREDVKRQLGVPVNRSWDGPCSRTAHNALMPDWVASYDSLFVPLLEDGIRVLVYAGLSDLTCPWLGQQRWLRALRWSGGDNFVGQSPRTLDVDGLPAGEVWASGPLAFATIVAAGHEVPMDQPEAAFQLIRRFITRADLATGRPASMAAGAKGHEAGYEAKDIEGRPPDEQHNAGLRPATGASLENMVGWRTQGGDAAGVAAVVVRSSTGSQPAGSIAAGSEMGGLVPVVGDSRRTEGGGAGGSEGVVEGARPAGRTRHGNPSACQDDVDEGAHVSGSAPCVAGVSEMARGAGSYPQATHSVGVAR